MSLPNLPPMEAWTPKREIMNILYYISSITESWQEKLALGGFLTFITSVFCDSKHAYDNILHGYAAVFGGDPFLVRLLIVLFLCDLGLGLLCSFVKRDENGKRLWNPAIFGRGVCKAPVYGVYVIVVAFVATSLEHSVGWGTPILNCFVAYMTIGESRSVLKNVEKLGMKIPPLLSWLVHGAHEKIENALKSNLEQNTDRRIGEPDRRENKIERRQGPDCRRDEQQASESYQYAPGELDDK